VVFAQRQEELSKNLGSAPFARASAPLEASKKKDRLPLTEIKCFKCGKKGYISETVLEKDSKACVRMRYAGNAQVSRRRGQGLLEILEYGQLRQQKVKVCLRY
jgi:hypothetical protein